MNTEIIESEELPIVQRTQVALVAAPELTPLEIALLQALQINKPKP